MELQEQVKVVAVTRQHAMDLRELKQKSLSEWEEQNKELLENLTVIMGQVSATEDRLRELTLQAYAETGNKAPTPGVGIRELTVLAYDNKVAFDWAKAHKMALRLDASAFEKIAKADPPDFVKITTEPQATIATDLSKVIKEGK